MQAQNKTHEQITEAFISQFKIETEFTLVLQFCNVLFFLHRSKKLKLYVFNLTIMRQLIFHDCDFSQNMSLYLTKKRLNCENK